jgi:hypothetical protein
MIDRQSFHTPLEIRSKSKPMNKMFHPLIVVIGCLMLLSACQGPNGYQQKLAESATRSWRSDQISSFSSLKGEPLHLSEYISDASRMYLFKDRYLVYDGLYDGFLLHIYDLHEKEFYHLAPEGKGPGECLFAMHTSYDPLRDWIWINDGTQRKLISYSLDSIFARRPSRNAFMEEVPLTFALLYSTFWLSDSILVGGSSYEKDRLFFFKPDGEIMSKKGVLPPKKTDEMDEQLHARIFKGNMIGNAKRTHWIHACWRSDWIEIYNQTGDLIASCFGPDQTPPEWTQIDIAGSTNPSNNSQTIVAFTGVAATEDHFYLLYSGRKEADTPKDSSDYWHYWGKDVFVMDLTGQPIHHYQLDRDIDEIEIRSDENVLYALDANTPDIIRYELPQ